VVKEGFTRFFHVVEEALLKLKLNGTQWAIYIAIRSQTIGDNRPEGIEMTLQDLSRLTGYHRTNIQPDLAYLIKAGPVKKVRGEPRKPFVLTVNDDIDTWNQSLLAKRRTVSQKANRSISQKANTLLAKKQTSYKKEGKEGKETRSPGSADVRFKPLKEFLFSDYQQIKGMKLNPVFNGSDGKALTQMLKSLPEVPIEVLQSAWTAFLLSPDKFYRKLHGSHPVRYWASNVNTFLELASNGSQAGHSRISAHNTKVGQDWLSRTEGK